MSKTRINNVDIKKPLVGENITLGSGISILNSNSGTNDLGSTSLPFNALYANNVFVSGGQIGNGVFVHLTGDSMSGSLTLGTGNNLLSNGSGVSNIGDPAHPFLNAYVKNVIASNITFTGATFVRVTGDTMTGDLTLNGQLIGNNSNFTITSSAPSQHITITPSSGITINGSNGNIALVGGSSTDINLTSTNFIHLVADSGINTIGTISPNVSGVDNLGSSSKPFNNIYANNIIATSSSGSFVHITGDTMTGDLTMTAGKALHMNPVLVGNGNTNAGTDSILVGKNNQIFAGSLSASTIGFLNVASGAAANAFGESNQAYGDFSVAFGYNNNVHGYNASAFGSNNTVNGSGITVFGNGVSGSMAYTLYIGAPSGIIISSGNNISPEASGIQNIGSIGSPFNGIYVKNAYVTNLSGLSPISLKSNLIPSNSGTINLGSASLPYGTIYADNIVSTGVSAGEFVHVTGDTMTGNLNMLADITRNDSNPLNISGNGSLVLTATSMTFKDSVSAQNLLNISEFDATIYGYDTGNAAQFTKIDSSAASTTINGYSLGNNNNYARLSLADGSSQILGYDSADNASFNRLDINDGSINLNGRKTTYGTYTRLSMDDSNFNINAFDTSTNNNHTIIDINGSNLNYNGYKSGFGSYTRINIDDSNFYVNGFDTSTNNTYTRENIVDSSATLNGYKSGYGTYQRFTINDGSFELDGFNSSFNNSHSRLTANDTNFVINQYDSSTNNNYTIIDINGNNLNYNGYKSGYGTYTRINIDDNNFYVNAFDSSTNNNHTNLNVTDNYFFFNGYKSGYGSYTRINIDDNNFYVNGFDSALNNLHTKLSISDNNVYLSGYESGFGSISRLSLGNSSNSINGYDSGNGGHTLLDLNDSGFLLHDYISGSGSFTVIEGNRTLTQVHSSEFKVDGDILANNSGTQSIGSVSVPFSGLHVLTINNEIAVTAKLNEKPSGTTNGINGIFTTLFTPFSGSTQLYANGIYKIVSGTDYPVGFDYSVSGNTLFFVSAPTSGSKLVINYNFIS